MKKKKFLFACGGALLALSIPVIASTNGGVLTLFGYNANADGGLYSLTLNRNTNNLYFEGDTTTVTTTLGNHVNFTHSGVTKLEGKVGVLAAGGYIQNTEKITGMTSITVEFSGTLTIEYAWENTTMLVKEELTSGVEYTFYDKAPSYFKLVNTGAEEAEIDLIDINYSCEYTIKKVVQINYLYKGSDEKISNPTYLILDKGERYGQEGVSGKGKLTVGADTYLPNKFWVAGIADKNEIIDITYTKASVYDGTYNPTTDTTRVLEGSGTTDNPFLIKSVEDLLWVEANSHKANHDSSYELKTSIDMTGYTNWKGIAHHMANNTTWTFFTGNFIGNGYTISGMELSGNLPALGLFANIKNSTVTNLTLNGDVNCTSKNGRSGIVAYQAVSSTVNNIYCYGESVFSADGAAYIGGAFGSINTNSTVSNVFNYRDVSYTGATTAGANNTLVKYAGGITGYLNTTSSLTNCINYGKIYAAGYIGGIAGQSSSSTITNCNNFGEVEYRYVGAANAGGISGYSSSATSYCINYGKVHGVSGATTVGGLIGQHKSTLTHSINYTDVGAKEKVGGLIGVTASATVGFCENYGNVTASSNLGNIVGHFTTASKIYGCIAGGNVYTGSCIGAIVGYCGAGSYVYGLNGHLEATEEYPASTVIEGIEVQGVTYPTEGKFKLIGDDQNNDGAYLI